VGVMGKGAVAPVHVAVAAAALLLAHPARSVATAPCPDANLRPTATNLPRVEAAMVCVLNGERKRAGRQPLDRARRLDRSAGRHTRDMVEQGYFAHQREGGPTLLQRIRQADYFDRARVGLYGENLGYAPPENASARRITDAFSVSEDHRRTMLYGRFRDVGVGAAYVEPNPAFYSDWPAVVFTLDFGRRYEGRRRCRAAQQETDSGSGAIRPRRWCRRRDEA
jgi:uncharacterized protein YkwD